MWYTIIRNEKGGDKDERTNAERIYKGMGR